MFFAKKKKKTLSGPLHPFPNLSMYLHHLSMYLIIPQEQPYNWVFQNKILKVEAKQRYNLCKENTCVRWF